ncbi:unnamed protein product [Coffea canephora]|uniref:Uncharacterized protein n=1 Tax=Coffea canephora TaxID=49390 RepID=A0A068V3I0_COFCA|nr:unnamed protein product [Coffea canephora]
METTFYRTLASFDRIPTHHALRKLAQNHGALMHLQLGEICSVVVSSPRLAKEIMKTHDLAFANRTQFVAGEILVYNCLDMVLCEYGDFWRQMRKYACTLELRSAKNVRSFESIRQDEVWRPHTRVLYDKYLENIIEQHINKLEGTKAATGQLGHEELVDVLLRIQASCKYQVPITKDNIKAVILDMLVGVIDNPFTTIEWAVSEMIRNPGVMAKAKSETREAFRGEKEIKKIEETDMISNTSSIMYILSVLDK